MNAALFSTPVLLILFNRPQMARQVFNRIRAVRPSRLFIACDGPRQDRPGEWERMQEGRRVVSAVDWECDVKTRFLEKNTGCRAAVPSAISWFFSEVEEGIVFEEDCLPDPTFFRYCRELLERYRDDERIMNISGVNSLLRGAELDDSYYFSRYPHIWGWASWRRAWRNYSPEMPDFPDFVNSGALASCFPEPAERKRWREILGKVYRRDPRFNTWDAQWSYAHFKNGALSVTPRNNLVANIGCTPDAMHTADNPFAEIPAVPMEFPLRHPQFPIRNAELDGQTFRYDYANPLWTRIRRRLGDMRGR
ncbi:MAG: glycosyltransferase family 2 protein [Lentisphaeria bacterium]|nr:glycosyltransferase family 2 protein [Lentisphaeria bacterium]